MEKKYTILKQFAAGGFGDVFKGIRKSDGKKVAIKRILASDAGTMVKVAKGKSRKVPLEIALLLRLRGKSGVVQMLDFYKKQKYFWLIMEKPYASMDLEEYSFKKGPLNNKQGQYVIRQLVNILNYLQSQNIFHSDVKEENVLLDSRTFKITLIDFGCSTILKKTPYTVFQGTNLYAPPEWVLQRRFQAEKATVWSIGVLAYTMIRGEQLFKYKMQIPFGHISFGSRFTWKSQSFIRECLIKNPNKRPTLKKLLKHIWLRKRS